MKSFELGEALTGCTLRVCAGLPPPLNSSDVCAHDAGQVLFGHSEILDEVGDQHGG